MKLQLIYEVHLVKYYYCVWTASAAIMKFIIAELSRIALIIISFYYQPINFCCLNGHSSFNAQCSMLKSDWGCGRGHVWKSLVSNLSVQTLKIFWVKKFQDWMNALVDSPGPTPTILLRTPTIPTKLIMIMGKLARLTNQNNWM